MKEKKGLLGFILKRAALALCDILAVNASYYLALLTRFFVNGQFRAVAENRYLPAFLRFWPWYTALSILIFAAWGLYSRRWKTAGLKDLNRIIAANLCTVLVQVFGTMLFVDRMPVTYYVIGAVIQLGATALIRFAYRFVILEKARLTKQPVNIVVGTGLAANHVLSTISDSVLVDGTSYPNGQEAIVAIGADRIVQNLGVKDGKISITTEEKRKYTDTSWAGSSEDVSFF